MKGMTPAVIDARPKWTEVRRCVLFSGFFLCLIAFAVLRWVWFPVKISGDSMVPNYYDGQPTYINRLAYLSKEPTRGDVVGLRVGNDLCIKRVIGLPGETIEFHRDTIVVNGRPLSESYPVKPLLWWVRPVHLGRGDYFVMGDNRTTSMLYAIHRDQIIGKAVY
jgi:signal peptidase I